jgi:hypothetical protein
MALSNGNYRNGAARADTYLIAAHLDFKGMLFRQEYLPQLLTDLAGQGINAVLLEYEAVFPFRSVEVADDPPQVWNESTLYDFQQRANELGIEIIPLQQCLGHLEYVFGWERYRHFALDHAYPSTLNLEDQEGKALVLGMLREMLEAHPQSRYIHLGLDEAFALSKLVEAQDIDLVDLLIPYLDELCELCESYGKTPIIWSDMLEDHLTPEGLARFERFRNRIVLSLWDYHATSKPSPKIRLNGNRISREWRNDAEAIDAPPLAAAQKWIEDLPQPIRDLIEPYRNGRHFKPLFQVEMWTQLGFRILGASATRISYDGPLLPPYHCRRDNIRVWSESIQRNAQLGQVATSWARGTSWCPPNYPFDLSWPLLSEIGRSMGAHPEPFFAGVEREKVDQIFDLLGRCREDSRCEAEVADEMEALLPLLTKHQFEWLSTILLTRLLALHRRAAFALLEVEDFHANHRPVDSEWQRRLDDQAQICGELRDLRAKVHAHFSQRYTGKAFEEWIASIFSLQLKRLESCREECAEKLRAATECYSQGCDVTVSPIFSS